MAVASARGTELERELAFGGVRQLLEPQLAAVGEDGSSQLFAGSARLAGPVFDPEEMETEGGGADPGFSILHGLYWLCANLAQAQPLFLSVDDAHWLDLASLRFLAYLGQRLEGLPLALVVAARPPPEGLEADVFVRRLRLSPAAVSLAPDPLGADAVHLLLREATGHDPDPEFAEECRRATGGVPLLLRELIRSLRDRGIDPSRASAPVVEEIGPPTIARYVTDRVRSLAPGAEAVARAAAVLGADAAIHRAARIARLGDDDAGEAVDALVLAGVLEEGLPLEFIHPVVRAAVYDDVRIAERSRLHREAASLLRDEGLGEDRIASHLLAAAPGGDPDTVELLLRTARNAVARGAPRSAVACLERALAEPPLDSATRCRVVHELGSAQVHAGEPGEARRHLEEAYLLAEPGRHRAAVAQDLSGCLRLLWDHREAAAVIVTALGEVESAEPDLALSLRAELILLAALEPTAHAPEHDRAEVAVSGPSGVGLGAAKFEAALTAEAGVLMTEPASRAADHAKAARDAGIVADLAHGGSLWINAVAPLILADGYDLAEQIIAEAFDAGRERTSVLFSGRAYVVRALLRLRQGVLPDAQADAETALEATGDAGFYFALLAISILVETGCERGELDGADEMLERAGLQDEIPDTFVHNWILSSRGRLRLEQGSTEEAVRDLEELGVRNDRRGQSNPALHHQRSRLATALLRAGDSKRAGDLAEEEVRIAESWGAPRAVGVALRSLGLCRGGEDGIARLRASVDVLARSGARLEHARSLVELGAAIRRSGTRSGAREPLHSGMELAHVSGAIPLVELAREELRATGARPRRIMRTGVDALTPSELRVARLAAEGLTNREIAQELFVTQRTVEGHLTHAFQKLDISSRDALAAQLAAEPSP